MVFLELAVARGVVAFLGHYHLIGLSTFAVNLLTMMAIAAATDYVIFLIGRYHEARPRARTTKPPTTRCIHGTAHVILGSGLTIAGATFCLHFTRLPVLPTRWAFRWPSAWWSWWLAALTLGPAVVTIGSHFGAARTQTRDADPVLAPDRHRRRPLAGTDPGRVDCAVR